MGKTEVRLRIINKTSIVPVKNDRIMHELEFLSGI